MSAANSSALLPALASGVFTYAFLAALALMLGLKFWLAARQAKSVAAHRNSVPADFAAAVELDAHRKAADYTRAKLSFGLIELVFSAAVLVWLTLAGGIDLVFAWAATVTQGIRVEVLGAGTVFAVLSLLDLPFAAYRSFVIEAKFGFNQMTWKLFIADTLKGLLLGLVLGGAVLTAAIWLMTSLGALWWLWAWFAWMAFNLLLLWLFPTFIAPLFNKFVPMQDGSLKARIEALLTRTGFKSQGLFVMDGSKRSSHGNAYFSGFGSAKRIVLFDTLISRLDENEVEAVLAHELGHFKKRHIVKRILTVFALSLAGLWLLGQLANAAWFYAGLGVAHIGAGTALTLFALVLPVFTFILHPFTSIVSRKHEYEADAFAAGITGPLPLISALTKLYKDNASTLTPDHLFSAFYDTHPPAPLRVARLKSFA
jgi:STE24 endopeptidase